MIRARSPFPHRRRSLEEPVDQTGLLVELAKMPPFGAGSRLSDLTGIVRFPQLPTHLTAIAANEASEPTGDEPLCRSTDLRSASENAPSTAAESLLGTSSDSDRGGSSHMARGK